MKITQSDRIIEYITEFGSITAIEAMRDLGILQLSARLCELKAKGYKIKSDSEAVKNRYGETVHIKRYSFEEE